MGYYRNSSMASSEASATEKTVVVDKVLKQVMDFYLSAEEENIHMLEVALDNQDFYVLVEVGDKLYGHGASFGFPFITQIGKKIELAAIDKDSFVLFSLIHSLKVYLQNVSIIYR